MSGAKSFPEIFNIDKLAEEIRGDTSEEQ